MYWTVNMNVYSLRSAVLVSLTGNVTGCEAVGSELWLAFPYLVSLCVYFDWHESQITTFMERYSQCV